MAPYCTAADLLLTSNLPMPPGLSKDAYVQQGADEIDFRLSARYKTPVVIADPDKYSSTVKLLKQLNSHLSTGRLVMALDAKGENQALHAYGWSLVEGALKIIDQILSGEVVLEGAPQSNSDSDVSEGTSRPMVFNLDPFSQVEAFYGLTGLTFPQPVPPPRQPLLDEEGFPYYPEGQ